MLPEDQLKLPAQVAQRLPAKVAEKVIDSSVKVLVTRQLRQANLLRTSGG